MKKVALIMGSDSDWPQVKSACAELKGFGIPFEAHIMSAHRTPETAAAQELTGAIMHTGAAVASMIKDSFSRETRQRSVMGCMMAPTVRQLK